MVRKIAMLGLIILVVVNLSAIVSAFSVIPPSLLDADGNRGISDSELLLYLDLWAQGRVSDYDMLNAIDAWGSYNGQIANYCWGGGNACGSRTCIEFWRGSFYGEGCNYGYSLASDNGICKCVGWIDTIDWTNGLLYIIGPDNDWVEDIPVYVRLWKYG